MPPPNRTTRSSTGIPRRRPGSLSCRWPARRRTKTAPRRTKTAPRRTSIAPRRRTRTTPASIPYLSPTCPHRRHSSAWPAPHRRGVHQLPLAAAPPQLPLAVAPPPAPSTGGAPHPTLIASPCSSTCEHSRLPSPCASPDVSFYASAVLRRIDAPSAAISTVAIPRISPCFTSRAPCAGFLQLACAQSHRFEYRCGFLRLDSPLLFVFPLSQAVQLCIYTKYNHCSKVVHLFQTSAGSAVVQLDLCLFLEEKRSKYIQR
jgi:hypothetical protein